MSRSILAITVFAACCGSYALAPTSTATTPSSALLPWSVVDRGPLAGAPTYFHAAGCDKDGSIVAARLAGATGGVADTRELALSATPSREADAAYAGDVASLVVDTLYASAAGPLLRMSGGAVVVSSVHRLALVAAEALHAPLLPAQTLEFALSWGSACAAARGGEATVLAGCDFGFDGLWLWVKPAAVAGVPAAHAAALRAASQLLLLRATDGDDYVGTRPCAGGGEVIVHSSLAGCAADPSAWPRAAALYTAAAPLAPPPPNASATLLQWEWGLPDATIAAYRAAWAAAGKPADALTLVELGVVPAYAAAPRLWAAYLRGNGVAPRGISLYSYWMSQPALDRADGVLPLPAYAMYKPDWHPLWDVAHALLTAQLANASSAHALAAHVRLFVNNVGSDTDVAGAQLLLSDLGLQAAWLEVGLDCPPSRCTDATGTRTLPPPHAVAAAALANASALLPPRTWQPMTVGEVAAAIAAA